MRDESEYVIYGETQIVSLLSGLMKSHRLISLFPENTAASSISIVTDVLQSDGCFMLDAVRDQVIHKRISNGSAFTFDTSIDGVKLQSPRLKAVNTIGDTDDLRYQISIPSRMHYFQRREAYRASVPALAGIETSVQLVNPIDGSAFSVIRDCELLNISANGCALSITENGGNQLSRNCDPLIVKFSCEEWDDYLEVSAIKRHDLYLEQMSRWEFGFQFIDLPPKARHLIDRLVANLQQLNRQTVRR